MMTLGLIGFVINAGLLLLTAGHRGCGRLRPQGRRLPADLLSVDTIIAAIVGAVVLSLVSTAVRLVVPD